MSYIQKALDRLSRNGIFIAEALFFFLIACGLFTSGNQVNTALLLIAAASVTLLNLHIKRAAGEQKKHASELDLFTQRLHSLINSLLTTQDRSHLLEETLGCLKSVIPNSACAAYLCGSRPGDALDAMFKIERMACYETEGVPVPDSGPVVKSARSMTPYTEYTGTGLSARHVSLIVFQSRAIGAVDICKPLGMTPLELKMYQLLIDYVSSLWVLYDLIAMREKEASVDPLTGVWNRRYMQNRFQEEGDRIARYGGSACVVMADMGNFKHINDCYGHAKGDEILAKVAWTLKKSLRASDCVGRYGGDEFLMLLPNIASTSTESVIGRVKGKIDLLRIKSVDDDEGSAPVDVVIDFGVAAFPGEAPTLMDTIKLADEAMFAAKLARKKRLGLPLTREEDQQAERKGDTSR